MRRNLKSLALSAAQIAAAILIERLLPAIAVACVAAGHELHFDSAKAEAERRAGR